ncbi:hypothetical protein ACFFGH_21295 [Lysobacter korlensis]|uniref:Uncharacterized protein n=1 Tax=Lysobacter korlensis TaxID=553636 RepID=A0ABV6RTR7_9GAMM
MAAGLDRLIALERALDDVRIAVRMLPDGAAFSSWRGPAHDAFVQAFSGLPGLLHSAAASLDRERSRALLELRAEHDPAER